MVPKRKLHLYRCVYCNIKRYSGGFYVITDTGKISYMNNDSEITIGCCMAFLWNYTFWYWCPTANWIIIIMIDNMISYAAMGTMESRNVPLKFAIKCFSEEQTNFMAEKIRIFSLVGKEMAIGEETFFSRQRGVWEDLSKSPEVKFTAWGCVVNYKSIWEGI